MGEHIKPLILIRAENSVMLSERKERISRISRGEKKTMENIRVETGAF